MKTQLLRPGFMIALASRMKGGVEYETFHEDGVKTEEGLSMEEWTTKKTVFDQEEHEKAIKVRGTALYQIRKLCVKTPFCLLCPETNEEELDLGVKAAKELIDNFNDGSVYTKIGLYVLKAKLLGDDEQTARAIAGEMRGLLTEMGQAIQKMDPEAIREALTKANEVSQMLVLEQQEKVTVAIELARTAAREITKTIKKKGSSAMMAVEDFRVQMAAVEKAKLVFLDFEEPAEVASTAQAPGVQVKELDLGESLAEVGEKFVEQVPSLDL
jgi:hypothetical protein